MKALSLFAVCVLTKLLVLADRSVPLSLWTPFALLWQDALVALVLGAIEFVTRRRPWIATSVFGLALLYLAINVPLTRVLSSPLTWPMSRAASGTLADSIRYHVTWENLFLVGVVLLTGALLPRGLQRISPGIGPIALTCGAGLVALGPFASAHVDCAGLQRNAFTAFVTSAFPKVRATHEDMDWRASGFEHRIDPALAEWRGAAAGRNVILIALESTGAGYLRPYGAAEDPMPNLTELAETSLLFENVYAVCPESIKGLFSVLRSRYPAFDTDPVAFERIATPSLARRLGEAGYRTALFHSGRFAYLGMDSVVGPSGFHVLEDAGAIGGNVQSSFGVDEPATVQRMLEWIDSLPRHQSFFLTYLPIAGHHPYATPEPGPFPGTDERSQYRNALHYADAALGELWRSLAARGLARTTLFVVYGDHGEAFGQHPGNYGHTQFVYEENVRVPCLVAAPGLLRKPVRTARLGSLIDVAPTVLDLLGLSIPEDYQGSSLLNARERMALFYTDYALPLVGLRDGPWKFIHDLDSNRSQLFNLARDPAETSNQAGAFPERVHEYRDRLQRWSQAQKGRLAVVN